MIIQPERSITVPQSNYYLPYVIEQTRNGEKGYDIRTERPWPLFPSPAQSDWYNRGMEGRMTITPEQRRTIEAAVPRTTASPCAAVD
jgi:hypothetical protein